MAYKTLYRKYRPNNFDDVCGQKYIITTLNNAIENDKISHAYLFAGTRGTGKTTVAKIFAKMVNCLNLKNGKPCGKCQVCACENTDEIPDIIEIDAASNNGVDEIRELKNKIKIMPALCTYKVYIIDDVHMLSTGAFNALLKTLEEPPEHVIFILATTEPQKLPITIISRCQRFDFKKISNDEIVSRLNYIAKQEKIKVTSSALNEISKLCDGAMRDAIGMLDQLSSYTDNEIDIDDIYLLKGSVPTESLIKLVDSYIAKNIGEMLNQIENIYCDGKSFVLLTEDLLIFFRNVLICKKAYEYFERIEISNKDEIVRISKLLSDYEIEKIILKFEKLLNDIKNSSYSRILFEVALLSDFAGDADDNISKEDVKDNIIKESVKKEPKTIVENKSVVSSVVKEEKVIESHEVKVKEEIKLDPIKVSDKAILINNTLAMASNVYKKEIKELFLKLDEYLLNRKYKAAATILKDASVAAASENYLLLTYKYSSMVDANDETILKIIDLIKDKIGRLYKIVAITEDEWNIERPKFVELKKKNGKIDLIEEKEDHIDLVETDSNEIIDNYADIFGMDIVEMEE